MQHSSGRGVRRGEPVALALLLGAYLILAAAYGLATPDLEAPDAGAHFRYVAFLRHHPQLPAYDLPTALVSHELVQQPPLYYAMVAALLPGADVQATVAYEQAVQTPYFEKGLGETGNRVATGCRSGCRLAAAGCARREPGGGPADGGGDLAAGAEPLARQGWAAACHRCHRCLQPSILV